MNLTVMPKVVDTIPIHFIISKREPNDISLKYYSIHYFLHSVLFDGSIPIWGGRLTSFPCSGNKIKRGVELCN